MTLTRDDLAVLVLTELARREAEIAARPRPPAWRVWNARPDADDREYGPRYSPSWFGNAAATEARRVRLLRTVYRLATAGLVDVTKAKGNGGKHVRDTTARCAALFRGAGFVFLKDVDAGRAAGWLNDIRRDGVPIVLPAGVDAFRPSEAAELLGVCLTALGKAVHRHQLPASGNGKARGRPCRRWPTAPTAGPGRLP